MLFIGIRAMTVGETADENLRAVVKAELVTKMSGEAGRAFDDLDTSDPDAVAAFLNTVDADRIEIHSMHISRPLLSGSTDETITVYVEYTLPGGTRTSEYWRMRRTLAMGWRYISRGSAAGYYLNFL